jgi:hypothetical protein
LIGEERFPGLQVHDGLPRSSCCDLQPLDGLPQTKRHTLFPHLMHEFIDRLTIDKFQESLTLVHHDHLDLKRGKHRRIFDSNDASADDDQLLGQPSQLHQVVAGEDGVSIGRDAGRRGRIRAHGDQNIRSSHCALAFRRGHGYGMKIAERRLSPNQLDVIPAQLLFHNLRFASSDGSYTMEKFFH